MKKLILVFTVLLISTILPQQLKSMNEIQEIVKNVKEQYAPDKRTAIFDVVVEKFDNNIILKGETNIPEAKKDLEKMFAEKNIKVKDDIEILPEQKLGEKVFGVVDVSVANLRTEPKHAAEMATQALLGTGLKVYKRSRDYWYLVQTPDKYIGWVESSSLKLMNKSELDEWNNSEKIIYTDDYGFSRSEKDVNSIPVTDLVVGDILKKVADEGDFIKVEYPAKDQAYIPKKSGVEYNVWLKSRELTADNIIKTAKQFMGIPYLWGGTSAKALDCSGFTKTVYYLNGVLLPRDASQQVNVGEAVDTENGFENLKPGDLLFFGRHATDSTKERITHVGIYIGNNEFIHESGKVRINSFDKTKANYSEYRYKQFIRAKRILTSVNKNGVVDLSQLKNYMP